MFVFLVILWLCPHNLCCYLVIHTKGQKMSVVVFSCSFVCAPACSWCASNLLQLLRISVVFLTDRKGRGAIAAARRFEHEFSVCYECV